MNIVTTSNYSPAIRAQAAEELLSTPTAKMIHKIPAMMQKMKSRAGDTIVYRRLDNFDPATVPVGNLGTNPPPILPTKVDMSVKPQLYGQYLYVNEQVVLQNIEDVVKNYAIKLGVSMRLSEDRLMRNMLAATSSAIYAQAGTNGDSPTEITLADATEVATALASADALTVLDSIEGEDRYGTAPISNAYFALSHTDIMKDLTAVPDSAFTKTIQYANQTNVLRAEYGTLGQLRFLVSSQGSKTANSSRMGRDILNNFVVGIEAIGCVYVDDMASEFIYLPKEYSGGLCQNVTMGMKFFEAPAIFNDLWVCNLRTTAAR
jgi:N4-gp56 family major capsid protein